VQKGIPLKEISVVNYQEGAMVEVPLNAIIMLKLVRCIMNMHKR